MNLIDKQQVKLLRRWSLHTQFKRKLTLVDIRVITDCITTGKYNVTEKDILMEVRTKWITYLKEEQYWIKLTRKQKHMITNNILNQQYSFRKTLLQSDVDFIVDSIKTGRYPRKQKADFNRIMSQYELYSELPF